MAAGGVARCVGGVQPLCCVLCLVATGLGVLCCLVVCMWCGFSVLAPLGACGIQVLIAIGG